MKKIVTFGEIMLRLAPPGFQRFTQARTLEATYGGGEANVAVSLANYGETVDFVTRLPKNDLGDACIASLRGLGVGTGHILRGGERIGIYFLETGAAQRASKVIYDRAGSSFASIQPGSIDWKTAFAGADWFHWTGITPAVSQGAAEVCREAILAARELGVTVSTDLNYRAKLWKWGKTAGEVMSDLVGLCDVALGNEEDAEKVFGIKAPESDITAGKVDADHYRFVCEKLAERFASLKTVSITLRGSISASHNTWSGVLWTRPERSDPEPVEGEQSRRAGFYIAPTYNILPIIDRVGGGDSFMGGLIYGLRKYADDPQKALNFAAAAACLKHSIPGDFNTVTVAEVETLMGGDASGRVSR
ncbi:MAG: sugar kinase [Anaerolineae bacterium]|nr:sugar kinase [Anaerolineae bacterium]